MSAADDVVTACRQAVAHYAVAHALLESQNHWLKHTTASRKELELVQSRQQQLLHAFAQLAVAITQGAIQPNSASERLRELSQEGKRILRYVDSLRQETEDIRNGCR